MVGVPQKLRSVGPGAVLQIVGAMLCCKRYIKIMQMKAMWQLNTGVRFGKRGGFVAYLTLDRQQPKHGKRCHA